MKTKDRFEISRDGSGKIAKGWRVERYSFGFCTIQHLRTGRSHTGVIDDFGNVVYPSVNASDNVMMHPSQTHNGYMS